MKIEKDKLVQINYVLKNLEGKELDSSKLTGPLEYVHGHKHLIVGLENQLEGKEQGDKFTTRIPAAEAYGEYDERLILDVPRDQFDSDLKIEIGMQFQGQSELGPTIVTVKKVTDNVITVDANHELAGQDLIFDIEVVLVRDMSEEELKKVEATVSECGGCGGCNSSSCGGCGGCGSCSN